MDAPRQPITATGLPPGTDPAVLEQEPSEQATPEEQAIYDQMVTRLGKFVWSEKNVQKVLSQINQSDKEVYETVGRAAYQLVKAEAEKAKAAGEKMSTEIGVAVAADYVIPWLFEIGEAAKVIPKMEQAQEQEQMGMALMEATRLHGESLLSSPKGSQLSAQAQDYYAEHVAKEADAGQVDPGFQQALRPSPIAAGVRREIGGPPNGA